MCASMPMPGPVLHRQGAHRLLPAARKLPKQLQNGLLLVAPVAVFASTSSPSALVGQRPLAFGTPPGAVSARKSPEGSSTGPPPCPARALTLWRRPLQFGISGGPRRPMWSGPRDRYGGSLLHSLLQVAACGFQPALPPWPLAARGRCQRGGRRCRRAARARRSGQPAGPRAAAFQLSASGAVRLSASGAVVNGRGRHGLSRRAVGASAAGTQSPGRACVRRSASACVHFMDSCVAVMHGISVCCCQPVSC